MPDDILFFPITPTADAYSGPTKVRKSRKRPSPSFYSKRSHTNIDPVQDEPPMARQDFTGQAIRHALYVAPDLTAWTLTGPVTAMPPTLTEPVLPGGPCGRPPRSFKLLDAAGWANIHAQLAVMDLSKFSAELQAEIAGRVRVIDEWAAAEGWAMEGTR